MHLYFSREIIDNSKSFIDSGCLAGDFNDFGNSIGWTGDFIGSFSLLESLIVA
jgi:hypothetical protein